MPKRHGGGFLDLYRALLKDIVLYDPSYAAEAERDISRIVSNVETRGLSVFLKDLPAANDVFETALSTGRLVRSHLPLMGGFKTGTPIPRLFKGLWLRVFDVSGCLKQDIDPMYVFFLEQLYSMFKKYEIDPPLSALYETTKEFIDVDEALPPPTLDWSGGSRTIGTGISVSINLTSTSGKDQRDLFGSVSSDDTQLLDTIQRVADVVSSSLGEYIPPETSRHGRGAVSEDLRGIEKYSRDIPWSSRLLQTFSKQGFHTPVSDYEEIESGEQPSILLAVPKTIKGPRLIAKEPTAHMFAQLSIMDWLYEGAKDNILRHAISFTKQELSGELARTSSETQSHGTIDLKSASDRVSLWLVERFFRRNISLLHAMADCRTQYIDLSIDKKLQKVHRLKKFTTQGSALTFPIQTIVFFIISVGVLIHKDGCRVNQKNIERISKAIRIYGDDIIVPTVEVENVIRGLEMLHLKVNAKKTHFLGYFRESCGVRAFKGVNITPSYVKRIPSGPHRQAAVYRSVVEASNTFAKKWLFNLADALLSTIPYEIRKWIPYSSTTSGSVVLHSYSGSRVPDSVKLRWNERYQREEVKVLHFKSKVRRLKVNGSLSLDAFLSMRAHNPIKPDYLGIDDWYAPSRWEACDVVSQAWVPLTS